MDRTERAFQVVTETVKQIITLSTGVLALTITFSKELLQPITDHNLKMILALGWLCYIFAIVAGVSTLQFIAGEISKEDTPSINRLAVRLPAIVMILFFWAGTVLTVLYGWKAYL